MERLISYNYIRQKALADPDSGEAVVYLQDIAEAPALDAVPVVRCRDCKHYDETDSFNCEFAFMKLRRPDDFCSYGERKDGDGDG